MRALTIDEVHNNIHEKKFYDTQKVVTDVADDGYVYVSLRPQSKEMHLIVTIDVEAKAYFKSYVDTTWTADGTEMTIFNRYIDSAPASTVLTYLNGTVNVLGTQRFEKLLPGGYGPFSSGATASGRIESILDAGIELTLEIQNVSGSAQDIGVTVEWYEVEE